MPPRFYVAKLTAENIDAIIADGEKHQFDLSDYHDNLECNAKRGFTTFVLVTVDNCPGTIAYTLITDAGLRASHYRYTGMTRLNLYDKIEWT